MKNVKKQSKMALIRVVFSKMFQRWPCQEDAERAKIYCQNFQRGFGIDLGTPLKDWVTR
jgi:hypothetical protein